MEASAAPCGGGSSWDPPGRRADPAGPAPRIPAQAPLTMAAVAAATEPPPGAAEREPTSRTKVRRGLCSRLCSGPASGTRYLRGRGAGVLGAGGLPWAGTGDGGHRVLGCCCQAGRLGPGRPPLARTSTGEGPGPCGHHSCGVGADQTGQSEPHAWRWSGVLEGLRGGGAAHSIIRSLGLKGARESRPSRFTTWKRGR